MAAPGPIHKNAGTLGLVALDTGHRLLGHAALDAELLGLGKVCRLLLLGCIPGTPHGQKNGHARECHEFSFHRPTLLVFQKHQPAASRAADLSTSFIVVVRHFVVHQVPVAFKTAFLISRPGVEHRPVGQHGAPFIGEIDDVAVAFQALVVFDGSVGLFPILFMIVRGLGEVSHDILDAMQGLGVEKIEGVLRRRQMAVHAVRHETLAVIGVG